MTQTDNNTDPGKEILTPKPASTPCITGARVFGVRPGKPILFRVSATGDRPMHFSAAGLPEGVRLDPASGLLTGTAPESAGDLVVKVVAENANGKDERELTLRVGDDICLTPPMGWNSWYCHSELISEQAVRETARAMVESGLADHGWSYINIDDCWQGERGGEHHAIQPNERFIDMQAMCEYVHGLGLKIGIYSTPWMGTYAGFLGGSALNKDGDSSEFYLPESERLQPHQVFGRCPGVGQKGLNRVGEEWFFDRDAKQWAAWGFDYVKVDWNPNDVPTTKRIHDDLRACDRDIVLSLSNAAPLESAPELAKYANCWRTTGDIHDSWESISGIGFDQEKWKPFMSPGHWNDPDMLQVGSIGVPNRKNTDFKPTRLTPDEQYMQMSMWCLLSAPLLLSCDIASLDDFTLGLLTNDEVLAVNQDAAGQPARRVAHDSGQEVWAKPLEDGSMAVGLFNPGEEEHTVGVPWKDLGLDGEHAVRDLWRQKDLGVFVDGFSSPVNPHGVVLVGVR